MNERCTESAVRHIFPARAGCSAGVRSASSRWYVSQISGDVSAGLIASLSPLRPPVESPLDYGQCPFGDLQRCEVRAADPVDGVHIVAGEERAADYAANVIDQDV